jgi:hypothetical protein
MGRSFPQGLKTLTFTSVVLGATMKKDPVCKMAIEDKDAVTSSRYKIWKGG